MDLEQAKSILLPIHGAFGVLALLLGFVALWSTKKRGRHTRLGKTFVLLMLLAIVVSVPVIVLSKNIFLGGWGPLPFILWLWAGE